VWGFNPLNSFLQKIPPEWQHPKAAPKIKIRIIIILKKKINKIKKIK
jgi:hypothetical protein